MLKTFSAALIILVLLAVGVYFYTHRPAADPTAWKTYENKKYGFSIQYPPNFVPGESVYEAEDALSVWFDDPATRFRYGYTSVWSRQSDMDNVSEYFTGPYPKEIPPSGNNSTRTVVERTINGLKGVEYYGIGGEGTSFDDVFMYKNKYLFAVYLDPVVEGRATEYREPGIPLPTEVYKEMYHRIHESIKINP